MAGTASTGSASVDPVDAAGVQGRGPVTDPVNNPVGLVPDDGEPPSRWGPRGNRGWLFAGVWLAYLGDTVADAWRLEQPERRVAGLVLVVVFAAYYLRVFHLARRFRWTGGYPMTRSTQLLTLAAGTVLTVLACVIIGQSGTAFTVYLAVVVVLVLPQREIVPGVALIMVVLAIVTRTVPGWSPDNQIVFSVFLATLALWGITQMIARNRQLALANEEITGLAVEQERGRFSRDLHDLLGHSLTVLAVKAELAGRLLETDPARAAREIADVQQLARSALADVRAAVRGVREANLAIELASARSALEAAEIEATLPGAIDDVPPARHELFGWVIREGVTNVIRHSGARRCTVRLSREAVEIVDDGHGPGGAGASGDSGGQGLAGLRERAEAVGATMTVGRASGGGYRLRVGW